MSIMNSEYQLRVGLLRDDVAANRMDAFIVTSKESIYYLCGATYTPMERPFFIIVWPSAASPTLLVPELEKEHMRKAKGFDSVESYWEYPARTGENWYDKLLELLQGKHHIGIEPSAKVEITEKLREKDIAALPLVDDLRMIKSSVEIEAIRQAARYSDYGMELMFSSMYKGVTPLELFSLSKKVQTKVLMAGEYDPLASEFLTACWPAPKSAQPHSVPEMNSRVGAGPIELMSFLRVNGYAAECERTVFLREPDSTMKEAFDTITQARKLAFGMLKPGVSCSEIDAAARDYLTGKGYGNYLLHRLGHGIGLGNHEGPWISDGSDHILQVNMVVSVEPGIYIPEIGGFRHSDTVLITATGYECLTKFPADLPSLLCKRANLAKRAKGAIIRKMLHMK
jgi:Xaa-Pro dipeptidase